MSEETYTTFNPEDLGQDTSHLAEQNLETLDVEKLHPLSPEVISRQATINVGTIGHVAHGKSTVVKSISGVQTVRFKNELERNITIKLGYANAKIYKCENPDCVPGNYKVRNLKDYCGILFILLSFIHSFFTNINIYIRLKIGQVFFIGF
jgi:hypothetical protein